MCGIAGLIDLTGRQPIPPGILESMMSALIHRGPDQEASVQWPGIGLGARRLSIVDLSHGRQPIANRDGTVWVVFNGELFDYPELRTRLESRGHIFVTNCDTELLPHLWDEYGEEFFEHVRGQFAFALWDQRRRQLILARDRFGICPLHWTVVRVDKPHAGEWLLFGSEIKALLASGMITARPDPRGIEQLFTFLGLPGPTTSFAGIQSIAPGRYLSMQSSHDGKAQLRNATYWQLDFPDDGCETAGDDLRKLTDDFEIVLSAAVKRRLRADVPVVSYLSGGVDSSLVVAMASKILGEPIPTFTVRVMAQGLDESKHAQTVVNHVGTPTRVVTYSARELLALYPSLITAAEAPVFDTSAAANLLLARRVHDDGYKVALTGEGADEWLAGYPWLRGAPFMRWLSRLPGQALVGSLTRVHLYSMGTLPGTYALVRRAEEVLGGHNPWLIWTALVSQARLRFFSKEMKEQLHDYDPFADLQLDAKRMCRWHLLNRGLAVGARAQLAGMLLSSKGDRVAMHSSVETRYPFLDEEVFSFLAQLPPRFKLRGFQNKYLLRKVAERWLPSAVAWRRKVMLRAPLDDFHRPGAPAYLTQLLQPEALRRTGYFDVNAVQHWRQRYKHLPLGVRRSFIELGLVGVVATQLWHQRFIDQSLADVPDGARF